MISYAAALALALAAQGAATAGHGPATDGDPTFVATARAATERYHDLEAAIADGYRSIGDDFPGMGQHWIHTGLLFDGTYDAARPEVLTYVTLDGTPRLLGVAYAVPLLDGEEPPEGPAGRAAWHAHSQTLDDETFAPHHHRSEHGAHGPRLAMVHAWVWHDNPEGLFAADNWVIPFLRLGLEPPKAPAPGASKALSLLSGSNEYVARVVRAAAAPGQLDEEALRSVIESCAARVAELSRRRIGARLSDDAVAELASSWADLWTRIESLLPADAAARLGAQAMR